MSAYFVDMHGNRLLPLEEERRLFKEYRRCPSCSYAYGVGATTQRCPRCTTPRDIKARNTLVEGTLKFVVKVAKEYVFKTKGVRGDDELLKALVSAGNLGVLVAVDRFDLAHGTKFLTYAAWWIREKILEELDNLGVVRVPAHKQKALRAQRKCSSGVDVEMPHVVLTEVSEIDQFNSDEQLERNLINVYGIEFLLRALSDLNFRERDKYIVLAYFGAKDDPKNLRQISNRLLISAERVRQLKKQALDRLKTYFERSEVNYARDVFG